MDAADVYGCYKPECSHLHFMSFKKLLAHIRSRHSHDPNFLVTCGRPGCSKTYKFFSSFKSHIYCNHPELIKETQQGRENEILYEEDSDDPEQSLISGEESDSEDDTRETSLRNVALFMLKTRECNKLSHTAMGNVLDETRHLVEMSVNNFRTRVEKCITQWSIELGEVNGLHELFNEKPVVVEATNQLSSSWREVSYLKENFN